MEPFPNWQTGPWPSLLSTKVDVPASMIFWAAKSMKTVQEKMSLIFISEKWQSLLTAFPQLEVYEFFKRESFLGSFFWSFRYSDGKHQGTLWCYRRIRFCGFWDCLFQFYLDRSDCPENFQPFPQCLVPRFLLATALILLKSHSDWW